MSDKLSREQISRQVYFSHIPDPKFKHNLISVNFIMPLDAKTASDNAAVPFILRKGCRVCPDFSVLNARLNELYGANMDTGVTKISGRQVLTVSIRGLDNRFALDGEDITGECASLLASVTLDPKLAAGGAFDEKDVALEKQFIIDSIQSEINDKRQYAALRCLQEMFKGEPVAVRKYGDLETAGRISPKSSYAAYIGMLEKANIEVMFTGSGNPDKAKKIFAEAFSKMKREPLEISLAKLRISAEKVNEVTETMELSQAKLVMGLRAGEIGDDSQLFAMRMCSALLGGTPFSKLFVNVREKLSLCYYCSASFDVFNKVMLISSGIESANRQRAQDEILRQLKAVQDGDFTNGELESTKLLVRNSLTSAADSPSSMESWYISQIMRGKDRSPQDEAAMLDTVTRERLVEAANKITLDTVYFLTGQEGRQ